MKQFWNIIFSTKIAMALLLVFVTAICTATFIEDKYDTVTAKLLIYNAKWFEFVLLLLMINFMGNIKKNKLFRKEKLASLIFHFSFIVMIIGGGVTRYTGFEGDMHIREGQTSNIVYSSEPYFQIMNSNGDEIYTSDSPMYFSQISDNSFHIEVDGENKGKIEVDYKDYVKNALEVLNEDVVNSDSIIEIKVAGKNGEETLYLKNGEIEEIGNIAIAYNNNEREDALKINDNEGQLNLISPYDIRRNKMSKMEADTVYKGSIVEFKENYVYGTRGEMFLFVKLHTKAKKQFVKGAPDRKRPDALIVDVSYNGQKHEATLFFDNTRYVQKYQELNFDSIGLVLTYGPKKLEIPFSIQLKRFTLSRYPGSNTPSSFKSEVVLTDDRTGLTKEHAILKNNVLDYDGYRFFQALYDEDEKGTILSVNKDPYGTWLSYLGYFLLALGFLLIMLSKNSRFSDLKRKINEVRVQRKATLMTIVIVLGVNGYSYSRSNTQKSVNKEHADKFGHLLVQSFDGRFSPVHTLAYDVMHKISGKDNFEINGKMNAMQVFLDMLIHPEFWKQQKIIHIREKSIQNALGINGNYASFNDFFDLRYQYKLGGQLQNAFRKKQSARNKFEREIIKVTERVNICIMAFNGTLLKIFPQQSSINNKWVSWNDTLAYVPITGNQNVLNVDFQFKEFNYNNIMRAYLISTVDAINTGDYTRADRIIRYIGNIQRQSTPDDFLPTPTKIELEIFYNNAQIFTMLKFVYAVLSVALLILAFIDNLKSKKSRILSMSLNLSIILLAATFIYHTFGMGLRWYLTGHAPWSNGYEALLLISWGGLLAGFNFVRYSKITLAATALLAFFMLMTASHSNYDPQLTNLQPVLKSYWLIIHVATITISYGFLGLGFILGIMNIFIYLFKPVKNPARISLVIKELTYINEKTLTIGLFLAALGTFFGGVWANESWGRYWGWDAKETWSLVIVIVYAMILHFRLIPKLKGELIFNIGSIIGFGSVIMTFAGVNYYFSKGLHSYASADAPVFPVWAWMMIIFLFVLIIAAILKEKLLKNLLKIS